MIYYNIPTMVSKQVNLSNKNQAKRRRFWKISEVMFPINVRWINQYQRKEFSATEKIKWKKYRVGSFSGDINTINIITWGDKTIIQRQLQ